MNPRRLLGPVVLALLAVGGAAWAASGRTWSRATVEAAGAPSDTVRATGGDAVPLLPALAVVALTAALAVLATGGRFRRAVGVLVLLVGAAGAALALTGGDELGRALDDAVRASPTFTSGNDPDVVIETAWRFVTAALFALVLLLGGVVAALGHTWPRMSGRYEAPGAPRAETDADLWKALDEGRDPTE